MTALLTCRNSDHVSVCVLYLLFFIFSKHLLRWMGSLVTADVAACCFKRLHFTSDQTSVITSHNIWWIGFRLPSQQCRWSPWMCLSDRVARQGTAWKKMSLVWQECMTNSHRRRTGDGRALSICVQGFICFFIVILNKLSAKTCVREERRGRMCGGRELLRTTGGQQRVGTQTSERQGVEQGSPSLRGFVSLDGDALSFPDFHL